MTRFFPAVFLIASFGLAIAHQSGSTKQTLEKLEAKMLNAYKTKDLAALKSLVTADFKVTAKGKSYDRDQWISMTKQMLDVAKLTSVSHTIQSIHETKEQAVLRTTTWVKGTLTLPDKSVKTLLDTSVDDETWIKQKGVWKLKLDKTISETTKLDGKEVKDPS